MKKSESPDFRSPEVGISPYSQIRCIALCVCKLWMGFSVPSIIWVGAGLMQITMQRTHPATKLRMTQDCSRLENNVIMSGFFFEGRRQTLLYSCKNKKDQKILWRKPVDSYPKRSDHKQVTLKHRNKHKWIEMHQSQVNMCFQRGQLRLLTEQKNLKFLRTLQNAQCNTTNMALRVVWPLLIDQQYIYYWRLQYSNG